MKSALKTIAVGAILGSLALGAGVIFETEAAPASSTSKVATMTCPAGWRGSAGGTYGGVPFSLGCASDRQSVVIEGTDGSAYSIRMGAETLRGAYDCFFTGDAVRVREACVEVKITIR